MKRRRFSAEQTIGIWKEYQAGLGAKELCHKHGIRDATFCKWRSKYGGMDVSDAKKLLAEQMMDVSTLKEMLGKTVEARFETTCWGLGHDRKSIPSEAGLCIGGN